MNSARLSAVSAFTGVLPTPDAIIHPARLRRLSPATLGNSPHEVQRPGFDPQTLRPGILHFGCGAFHRAHQAVFTQRAIDAELSAGHGAGRSVPPPWGIVSASLRTPDTVRALQRQGGLYSVLERGAGRGRTEVVGVLTRLIHVPDDPGAMQHSLADPAIRLVTLTVTQAGYCTDPATSRLDPSHPDIQADLRRCEPRSTIGLLVQGLAQRRAAATPPPVVLSCDNLPTNGRLLRQACIDFAALQDDGLSQWIAGNVRFPNTMVDRIVPAITDRDRADAAAALGLADAAPVVAEPFSQWVIEQFDGARPRWEAAGARYVNDVGPWEASKLRMLNGGHLAVAYLGLLAGLTTVAEAMAQPRFAAFALRFMLDEQRPTLPPSDHDIDAYAQQLLARWRNPAIVHRLDRVARDGCRKIAPRLLASLRDNLHAGRPAPCTVLAVAAWMRCASGRDWSGRRIDIPGSPELRPGRLRVGDIDDPASLVDGFLEVDAIFGDDLPRHPGLRDALVRAAALLRSRGVPAALADCLSGVPA